MSQPAPTVWSAQVRYAEADQQGIAFNAHYLTWADEAMGAFCAQRGLLPLAERVHLVSSSLTWQASARWGDRVDVAAECTRIGSSSIDMQFTISVAGAQCCTVQTTYVNAADGAARPLTDDERAALVQR